MQGRPILEIDTCNVLFLNTGKKKGILHDLTFRVERGEILGLVGESGSGKTLTALTIMGLLPADAVTSGSITYTNEKDQTVHILNDRDNIKNLRGRALGMIFQNPYAGMNPTIRCGQQIDETLRSHRNLPRSERKKTILTCFETLRLEDPERIYRAYPHTLSGGELQRVCIAQNLVTDPDILIADEPTTALDVTTQKEILDLFRTLNRERRLTILLISHDLGVVKEIADRVVVIRHGKIVESGDVSGIFSKPVHPYTIRLLAARPPLEVKLDRLPIADTLQPDNGTAFYKDWLNTHRVDQDTQQQQLTEIMQKEPLYHVMQVSRKFVSRGIFTGKTEVQALHDMTLYCYPGETLGIVGESGSGKTTLAKILSGLERADRGQVLFKLGKEIILSERTVSRFRRQIQMIFQDPYTALYPHLNLRNNLREVQADQMDTSDTALTRLLELVHLPPEYLEKYPHQLSGGERQRVQIARAIALRPKVLICDECVSALDVTIQARILNLLKDLKEAFDMTLVFISHDMSVVRFMADRILVMKAGRIVERGETEELFRNPQTPYTRKLLAAVPGYTGFTMP